MKDTGHRLLEHDLALFTDFNVTPPESMRRLLTASYKGCSSLSIIDIVDGIEIATVETPPSPTWITRSATGRILVVCSGHVVLLAESGEINVVSVMKASGNRLVHGCWSTDERFVLAVDYDGGTVEVFPVVLGKLRPATFTYKFFGQGGYPPLQASSHPHQVVAGPGQRYYVTDLGTDRIHAITLRTDGMMDHHGSYVVYSAAGPRHLVFHPTMAVAYVLGEIGLSVTTMAVSPEGDLRPVGPVSLDITPPEIRSATPGFNTSSGRRGLMASAIQISKNAGRIYLSIRAPDTAASERVVVCDVARSYPYLPSKPRHFDPHGQCPREIVLDELGKTVVVCNQSSGSLALLDVDQQGDLLWSRDILLTSGNQPTAAVWLGDYDYDVPAKLGPE